MNIPDSHQNIPLNESSPFDYNSVASDERHVNISLLSSMLSGSSDPVGSIDISLSEEPNKSLTRVPKGSHANQKSLDGEFSCANISRRLSMRDSILNMGSQINLITSRLEHLKVSLVEKEQENYQMKQLISEFENQLQVANTKGNRCGSCYLF